MPRGGLWLSAAERAHPEFQVGGDAPLNWTTAGTDEMLTARTTTQSR